MKLHLIKEYVIEIFHSLKAHKIRTILTAFGISWGIFILIVLLGISGGLKEGVFNLFKGFTKNTVWFHGGRTDKNSNTRESGKNIQFSMKDINKITRLNSQILYISPEINNQGTRVFFEDEQMYINVKGVSNQYFQLKGLKLGKGRPFNYKDIKNICHVAVVGDRIKQNLFKNTNPIGQDIIIENCYYMIIGTLDKKSFFAMNEQNSVFIPRTTFSKTIREAEKFNSFGITVKGNTTKHLINRVESYLSREYNFPVTDQSALYIVDYKEQLSMFSNFFNGFNLFLVFVGCCLLLSGIIGVSNIMYIIVKERTYEIGIKKAIGAPSSKILMEYILESVILTVLAGITGIILGIGTLIIIDLLLAEYSSDKQLITKTMIEMKYVVLSIMLLSFSGFIAGVFPAKKAAEVKPVEAIQSL
jgi:putative ABC transport system permease protein